MKNAGFAMLLALLFMGCGESGNPTSGSAPVNPAPSAGSPVKQAQPPKDSKEQPAEPRRLPPSEPYGTTGN